VKSLKGKLPERAKYSIEPRAKMSILNVIGYLLKIYGAI